MPRTTRPPHISVLLVLLLASVVGGDSVPAVPAHEEACRANNVGVALLEQVKYAEAADAFRRALKLDPRLDIAQVNLAIALFNVPDVAAAEREAAAAVERGPAHPQAHYVAGLVAKAQNRADDAIAAFGRVLRIDADDVGASVNLAQLLMQQQKHAEAVALLRRAAQLESYNSTAAYSLATALLRSGQTAEGQEQMKRFQALREAGYATSLGQNYPQQGRYAEALVSTGNEPTLVESATPSAVFRDATDALWPAAAKDGASPASAATLVDFDGDGDLDVLAAIAGRARLLRNDKGKFADVATGPLAEAKGVTAAVAGDYDNDGAPDVLLLLDPGVRLYHNEGGTLADVSAAAGVAAVTHSAKTAAFVDIDHDGDLDLFIGGAMSAGKTAPPALLRNDGAGKLVDVAGEAKLQEPAGTAVAVIPTDYDNRRDVDLLVAREAGPVSLFMNLRHGAFHDVARETGLEAGDGLSCAAAGDVNKDTYTDFFFGRTKGAGVLALSNGRGGFTTAPAPEGAANATAAQFLDYDNDGRADLVVSSAKGLRVLRHLGDRWADVTSTAVKTESAGPGHFASGDLDGDGDTDLALATAGGLRLVRNEGGERNASLRVVLAGKTSNRSGVGAKVEARAGSLRHKLELYAAVPAPAPADLTFGLGTRTTVDAVRILWPSGTLQAETELPQIEAKTPRPAAVRTVEEVDRTPSSCPYLFAWNGERFAFVTDFMGGGEMGAWLAPGVRNRPDPEEYVRVGPDQLRARDGRYELRITHELEEVLYVDQLELIAIAHPAEAEVHPNEGLTDPPRPFQLHAVRGARPPIAATDEHGHDVLARVREHDGQAVDDFETTSFRGYAAEHSLTLDLGPAARDARLLLTGWTEYSFSSDNVAAHQAGLALAAPKIEVRPPNGRWETAIADIGFPVGRPQTIVVDLAGHLPAGAHEIRIVTNMRIFWDQVRVDTSARDVPLRTDRLSPSLADLRARGFSAPTRTAGSTVLDFDYQRVSTTSPWKLMPGRYTRLGDVKPLLAETDDRFAVCHPGDEIALSFDADALPPLPAGWTRTFLLRVDGYSKEMNVHSASPDVVAPLPFHGMSEYPYSPAPAPVRSEVYREYVDTYNTRVVTRGLPLIEVMLLDPRPALR